MWNWLWGHKKIFVTLILAVVLVLGYLGLQIVNSINRTIVERFETADAGVSDYVNWTGRLENGSYVIYMLNVHDSAYCVRNERTTELAAVLRSMKVWTDLEFQSIYAIDIIDRFLCEPSTERSKTYRVLSIKLSSDAWYNLTQWQYDLLEPYRDIIDLPPRPEF